jgi:hypothetical protein
VRQEPAERLAWAISKAGCDCVGWVTHYPPINTSGNARRSRCEPHFAFTRRSPSHAPPLASVSSNVRGIGIVTAGRFLGGVVLGGEPVGSGLSESRKVAAAQLVAIVIRPLHINHDRAAHLTSKDGGNAGDCREQSLPCALRDLPSILDITPQQHINRHPMVHSLPTPPRN